MKKFKVTFITGNNEIEAVYVRASDYSQCQYAGIHDSVDNLVMASKVVKVELCLDVMDQTGDVAGS
ncbi:hypothetical protein LCGC14_0503620 [marine sediment metagenome]|uniref:Uncharacterized protein n=1 Tax=marine sediment metagenome TaxID=412755 RepID=A0A0F9S877_9ZZZZ